MIMARDRHRHRVAPLSSNSTQRTHRSQRALKKLKGGDKKSHE